MKGRVRLADWAPGLDALRRLRPADIPRELAAGASVAAIAIPGGLAFAALIGAPAVVGLYAGLLPTAAYAVFGPARYLIVGPDTATCLLVASALTALGLHDPSQRAAAAAALALIAGVGFALAAVLRLGFVANLLSRPILVGYLAGVALTLLVSQIGAFTGVAVTSVGLLRPVLEIVRRSAEVNLPSLLLGVGLLVALRLMAAFAPRWPAPAVVVVAAILLSWALDLPSHGVAVIGTIPAGLPALRFPAFDRQLPQLGVSALSLLLVSFCSGALTARSFGQVLGLRDNADKELRGFAAANIAAGLFQGFPVTGADSRTAVALAAGGRTPLVAIASAVTIALVLAMLTGPLALLPQAALGAVLASAALGLIDLQGFLRLWRIDRIEVVFALVAMAGVIWLGVLQGVFLAIAATFARLLQLVMWPACGAYGLRDDGRLVSLANNPGARPLAEGVVFGFQASLLFFNADYFLDRAEAALEAAPDARWFILDAQAVSLGDSTGLQALSTLKRALDRQGARLHLAGAQGRFRMILERSGFMAEVGRDAVHQNAAAAYARLTRAGRRERRNDEDGEILPATVR